MKIPFTKMLNRNRTLVRFSTASAANSVTGMIAGFLILRWVPPDELGVWQALLIVQTYAGVAQGGVAHGLNRELPFRLGAGDASGRELAASAQTFCLIVGTVMVAAAVGTGLFLTEPSVRMSLPVVFAVAGIGVYSNYLAVTFRADQAFERLAKIYIGMAALNIVTLPLVRHLGYPGIPIRVLLLALVQVGATHLHRPMRLALTLEWQHIRTLMNVGLPLFGFGWLIAVSATFPKTILLLTCGVTSVGQYAPAGAALAVIALLPGSVAQYIYSRMSFNLGKSNDLGALWRYTWKASLGTLVLVSPFVVVAAIAFPAVVLKAFPKYSDAAPAVVWTCIAGAFFACGMYSSALNSMKAWRWIAITTFTRAVSSFGLPLAFVALWPVAPLAKVSMGYCLAGVVSFVVGLGCVYKATHPTDAMHNSVRS